MLAVSPMGLQPRLHRLETEAVRPAHRERKPNSRRCIRSHASQSCVRRVDQEERGVGRGGGGGGLALTTGSFCNAEATLLTKPFHAFELAWPQRGVSVRQCNQLAADGATKCGGQPPRVVLASTSLLVGPSSQPSTQNLQRGSITWRGEAPPPLPEDGTTRTLGSHHVDLVYLLSCFWLGHRRGHGRRG